MMFVPSGATGALTISMTDGGMYKATVKVGDGCAAVFIAEYLLVILVLTITLPLMVSEVF
jgi:hypothetical protein